MSDFRCHSSSIHPENECGDGFKNWKTKYLSEAALPEKDKAWGGPAMSLDV